MAAKVWIPAFAGMTVQGRDDGAGRAGMTVQEGAKTVQGPDSTALWEMGFARRMAPQAPKARNLTLAAVLGL